MLVALVTTTIYVPRALDEYLANARRFGHTQLLVVVTGDRKTPAETGVYCSSLQQQYPEYRVVYLDPSAQVEFLARYPELSIALPWSCIQRRNVSFLYAYEARADVIITIDDDNLIERGADVDFVGTHVRLVSGESAAPVVSSSRSGWVNVCRFLEEEHGVPFYHRGFPMDKRWTAEDAAACEETAEPRAGLRVCVNAGLWLGDPDVDAIARIYCPVNATRMTRADDGFVLAAGSWSPFNSQNTSFARAVLPAYFMAWNVGRYDDIWPSYVVRRIADHLGFSVRYGTPIVRQERNPHNYYVDLENEKLGMRVTPEFTRILRDMHLEGRSFADCFEDLVRKLRAATAESSSLKADEKAYIETFCATCDVWRATVARANAIVAAQAQAS